MRTEWQGFFFFSFLFFFFCFCLRVSKARRGRDDAILVFKQNMPGGWACSRSPCFPNSVLYINASVVVREMQGKEAGDYQPRVTNYTMVKGGVWNPLHSVEPFLPFAPHLFYTSLL